MGEKALKWFKRNSKCSKDRYIELLEEAVKKDPFRFKHGRAYLKGGNVIVLKDKVDHVVSVTSIDRGSLYDGKERYKFYLNNQLNYKVDVYKVTGEYLGEEVTDLRSYLLDDIGQFNAKNPNPVFTKARKILKENEE